MECLRVRGAGKADAWEKGALVCCPWRGFEWCGYWPSRLFPGDQQHCNCQAVLSWPQSAAATRTCVLLYQTQQYQGCTVTTQDQPQIKKPLTSSPANISDFGMSSITLSPAILPDPLCSAHLTLPMCYMGSMGLDSVSAVIHQTTCSVQHRLCCCAISEN
jgi:hypothetical protein